VFSDASGQFVGFVSVDVTAGWLNAPHAVRVNVTSDNLVINEPHGEAIFPLTDLEVNGVIEQGVAEVIIQWVDPGTGVSLDTNPTTAEHNYEVCASVIFADQHESDMICIDNFFF
jgi:hypothetical protein